MPGGRLFEDLSRLVTDATGLAQGMRREVETVVRGQVERLVAAMDLVSREEFEAARQMAILARDDNERLERRIAALEARLTGAGPTPPAGSGDAAPVVDPQI